jgi:hypothetical protein
MSLLLRRALPLALVLATATAPSVLLTAPAVAHPEECAVTDDRAVDEECESHHGGKDGSEGAEDASAETVITDGRVAGFQATRNMHALGAAPNPVPFSGPGSTVFNSDLAFRGTQVVQGTYNGFRIVDVADPENPVEVVDVTDCTSPVSANGSQGDVIVHGDVLVRSWDAARGTQLSCSGVPTPAGQEGVHVFDISDPAAPRALTFVATPCGSHTASAVPDPANRQLLVYNSPSSAAAGCQGIDVLRVPLDDPASASYVRHVPSGTPGQLPSLLTVGGTTYQATAAAFGPSLTLTGVTGPLAVVRSGTGNPAEGCGPLVDFPAGAVAVVDRGTCPFVDKVRNAQAAGAVGVVVANNAPGAPILIGGTAPDVTIPSAMVAQADAAAVKAAAGQPAVLAKNPAPALRACHDTGVILGTVLKAACAGGDGVSVWSMSPADGGSLESPALLYSRSFPGVSIGHSAAFSWDGAVLVFGHEPGGGGEARCQATSSEVDRTLFFLDAATGATRGTLVHPRPQTARENCTWHNYNVVPTDKGHVLVSGSYQAGISVIDFTDPSAPREIAFADPAPLSETGLVVGGDWSTYWYDGRIYQSDIRRGLLIWKLSDPAVAGARKLGASNPQTAETSFAVVPRGTGRAR